MNVIAITENGKLIHKKVYDQEYIEIMNKRDPDGMEWFRRFAKMS